MNSANLKKLSLALLAALACVGLASLPALAAKKGKGAKPLRVESVAVATKSGPLTLRVRASVHAEVAVWVNGRRVRHSFQQEGRHSQEIELRAADGLRAGPNRLRLRARSHGEVAAARRTVRVPRRALLVDAGPDAGAAIRVHSQLGTVPPLGGATPTVDYTWRIVSHSKGGSAKLLDRHAPRPLLRAQTPGTFVLEVEADPEGPPGPAFDSVTVAASPNDPPIGVPIDTLTGNGISVGGASYGNSGDGLSYAILQRTTRAVVESGYVGRDAAGLQKLNDLAARYGEGGNYMRYLMIVSGPRGTGDLDVATARLFKALGSPRLSIENFAAFRANLPFSIVGIPGAPLGAATIRIPGGGYADPVPGAITGYLQKNQAVDAAGTPVYDLVTPEHPLFDTKAPGSSDTTDVIQVGDQRYSMSLPGGASAGFHVLVLESLTLRKLDDLFIKTNGGGNDRTIQSEAAAAIRKAIDRPGGPTVLIQTIGKPKAAGPEWEAVVYQLVRLGANPQLVNALYGNNEYSLVSRLGSEQPPAEASTAYDVGPYPAPQLPPARLRGILARTRTSTFEPTVFGTPTADSPNGGVNTELVQIAYQPSQGWPALAPGKPPAEVQAAVKYVCEALNFCQKADSCAELRECFWQKYEADWTDKAAILARLPDKDGPGFKKDVLEAIKPELEAEMHAVANVKFYLEKLQRPLDLQEARSSFDLQKISDEIWNSLQRPGPDNSGAWALGLVGKIIAVGQLAGPPVSAGASGLSAIFGLASYLSTKTGQPILGSEVKARATALGSAMFDRISQARREMDGLGMLIVSDYGKLTAANQHVDSDWSPKSPDLTAEKLRTAAKQWFYEALVPTAYPYLIRANSNNATQMYCPNSIRLWPNQPDSDQMLATTGYDGNGNPIRSIFYFTRGIGTDASPPASLGEAMFAPQIGPKQGLGIEKLQFFTARVFGKRIVHAINQSYYCSVLWLPVEGSLYGG